MKRTLTMNTVSKESRSPWWKVRQCAELEFKQSWTALQEGLEQMKGEVPYPIQEVKPRLEGGGGGKPYIWFLDNGYPQGYVATCAYKFRYPVFSLTHADWLMAHAGRASSVSRPHSSGLGPHDPKTQCSRFMVGLSGKVSPSRPKVWLAPCWVKALA